MMHPQFTSHNSSQPDGTLFWLLRCVAVVAALAGSASAFACDIPVYEYTIQNWQRDAYEIVYVYRGIPGASDGAVNTYLKSRARAGGGNANITFSQIDAASPVSVDAEFLRRHAGKLPRYVVVSPKGNEIHNGPLDSAAARNLLHSPRRTQLAEQLCTGRQGMLILLHGDNSTETVHAKRVVNRAAADARMAKMNCGVIEISRSDLAEKWFVRKLLGVEADLAEVRVPMVFSVFGRGHVMEPLVGKGISEDNVRRQIEFMNGECACEIKSMSRGIDMITDWDWETGTAGHTPVQERPLKSVLFNIDEPSQKNASTPKTVSVAQPVSARPVQAKPAKSRKSAALSMPASVNAPAHRRIPDIATVIRPGHEPVPAEKVISGSPAAISPTAAANPPAVVPDDAANDAEHLDDCPAGDVALNEEIPAHNLPAAVLVTLIVACALVVATGVVIVRRREHLQ